MLGTKQYILSLKQKLLKKSLKELNREYYGHISVRTEFVRKELEQAQLFLHDSPFDKQLRVRVKELREKAVFLCDAERKFYAQKIKCAFLLHGIKVLDFFTLW